MPPARRARRPPPPAAVLRRRRPRSRGAPGAGRRGRGARRLARDGGAGHVPRRRHQHPAPVRPEGQGDLTGQGPRCCTPASAVAGRSRWRRSSPPAIDVGAEKNAYEPSTTAGKERKTFIWKPRSPARATSCFGGLRRSASRWPTWASSAAARSTHDFVIGSDAEVDAPVSPEFTGVVVAPAGRGTGADYVVNVTPRDDAARCTSTASATRCSSSSSSAAPASRCPRAGRARLDAARPPSSSPRRRGRARWRCRS